MPSETGTDHRGEQQETAQRFGAKLLPHLIPLRRCYGSTNDNANALAAAATGLELAPRDPDLLRSQATALAGLGAPEAPAALAAYDRFRSPDNSAELRISCAGDSVRCAREREQGHTHVLRPVR